MKGEAGNEPAAILEDDSDADADMVLVSTEDDEEVPEPWEAGHIDALEGLEVLRSLVRDHPITKEGRFPPPFVLGLDERPMTSDMIDTLYYRGRMGEPMSLARLAPRLMGMMATFETYPSEPAYPPGQNSPDGMEMAEHVWELCCDLALFVHTAIYKTGRDRATSMQAFGVKDLSGEVNALRELLVSEIDVWGLLQLTPDKIYCLEILLQIRPVTAEAELNAILRLAADGYPSEPAPAKFSRKKWKQLLSTDGLHSAEASLAIVQRIAAFVVTRIGPHFLLPPAVAPIELPEPIHKYYHSDVDMNNRVHAMSRLYTAKERTARFMADANQGVVAGFFVNTNLPMERLWAVRLWYLRLTAENRALLGAPLRVLDPAEFIGARDLLVLVNHARKGMVTSFHHMLKLANMWVGDPRPRFHPVPGFGDEFLYPDRISRMLARFVVCTVGPFDAGMVEISEFYTMLADERAAAMHIFATSIYDQRLRRLDAYYDHLDELDELERIAERRQRAMLALMQSRNAVQGSNFFKY